MTPPWDLPFNALDQTPGEIARRVAWGRAHGHPYYVTPDVPLADWRAALAAVQRATVDVLNSTTPVRLAVPAPAGARALGLAGFASGMGPLLGYWLEQGRLITDDESAAVLRLHLAHGRRRWARCLAALQHVVAMARDAHVVVLKGAHTASVYFPDPGARPAVDIDIVVEPEQAARIGGAMALAGYTLGKRGRQFHRSEWQLPGGPSDLKSVELMHADNPITIEVHTSLAREFHGVRAVRLGMGAGAPYPWPGSGPSCRVLAQPELLAFLAIHAAEELHRVRLIQLVELALVARQDAANRTLDWDAFLAALRKADALRFAYPAVALAAGLVPDAIPVSVVRTLHDAATPGLRQLVQRGVAATLEPGVLADPYAWTSGPWEVMRRAAFMLWPQEDGRSARDVFEIYQRRVRRVLGRASAGQPR